MAGGATAVKQGISEFIFGAERSKESALLKFWDVLGFRPVAEGSLDADAAGALYGHRSGLRSLRLKHAGCDSWQTGYVRLQLWDRLRNEGLGNTRPIAPGSRWMGLYCQDILQLRDAVTNETAMAEWDLWVSPLVNAPLAKPAPEVTFFEPFVGLRETLVFGRDFRLAFIQRGGFDRPGFGTVDDSLLFRNTEGSHASLVQATDAFDTDFYKAVFGFETAPFGEAHDSGDEPPTRIALKLKEGELFHVERTRAVEVPSGLLQVYSSYTDSTDRRDLSRAGSGSLGLYSVHSDELDALRASALDEGASACSEVLSDEFGAQAFTFDARDGLQWLATDHVG